MADLVGHALDDGVAARELHQLGAEDRVEEGPRPLFAIVVGGERLATDDDLQSYQPERC